MAKPGKVPGPVKERMAAERRHFNRRFPWLASHRIAILLADERYAHIVATGAKPRRETLEEAVEWAAAKLGIRG